MSKVKIGKKIPVFTSTLDDGSEIKSTDLIGKNIVIYFQAMHWKIRLIIK